MANPFWGNPAIAEYSPMSMQEIMAGPQELYKRDRAEIDKLEALNEANLTLQGALGEHAPKQEEFSAIYNKALENINREGATPKNLELVKQARQLYATHVLPMQDFAKKREAMATEYAKARADGDNILTGDNPLNKSFDEWRKNPDVLNSFQAISRDKLYGMGAAFGKNYAEGTTGRDTTDIDLGIMNFVKGFKTSNDAANAYSKDPQFRGLVDAQVEQIAKARGIDPSNPEVRSVITTGIMSGVVGGLERAPVSAQVMKKYQEDGQGDGSMDTSFIDMKEDPNLNLSEGDDVLTLAQQNPAMMEKLNQEALRLTDNKYNFSQMQQKIESEDQQWRKYAPDVLDRTGLFDPEGLRAKRKQLEDITKAHPYFATTMKISLNDSQIAKFGKPISEDVKYRIKQTMDRPISNALLTGALIDKAYTKEDKDLLEAISKQEVGFSPEDVQVEYLGYQGMIGSQELDDRKMLKNREVIGTGKPVIGIQVKYKDSSKKELTRIINVMPTPELYNAAREAVSVLYNPKTSSLSDKIAIKNMEQLHNSYFNKK